MGDTVQCAIRRQATFATGQNILHHLHVVRGIQFPQLQTMRAIVGRSKRSALYSQMSLIGAGAVRPASGSLPGRTVADLLPETVGRLAEHDNIVAIKEATGDMQRLRDIQAVVAPDFGLLSGDDFTVLPFIEQGGHGVVTVSGNVVPAQMAELCRLASAGEREAARAIDDRLQPLNSALFVESNPIPVKWAVSRMGLIGPGIRLPLTEFSEQYHGQMLTAMAGAGVELRA